jgi:hypothetical protein
MVSRRDLTAPEIERQLHWQYKWDRAIVDRSSMTVRRVESGPLAGLQEVSLDARIVPLGRPPFVIRIVLYFRDFIPKALQDQIFRMVDRFLANDAREFNDIERMLDALQHKLATEFPHADRKFDIKFHADPANREAADITISDASRPVMTRKS